jgi:hypothetical protein
MIAGELNGCTVHQIITQDLNMRKVRAKMVPKNLKGVQKACRIEVSAEILERIITGEGNWFFEYDPETKGQSEEWYTPQSPRQMKAHMSRAKCEAMVVIYFNTHGVVHE